MGSEDFEGKIFGLHDSRLVIMDLLLVFPKTMTDYTCCCIIALGLLLEK